MLTTIVQSAINKLGGPFSKAFLSQPCRKETGDNSVVESDQGYFYRLESVLGVGGLSAVYRAFCIDTGSWVALKVGDHKKVPEAKEMMVREAELMSRLDHPNIVKLYDHGSTSEGDPFIAMEILEGQTLEQLLLSETVLDLNRVSEICLQVAEAVQHAHENGILHRDIKPSNIMIVQKEGVERAMIFDFGISMTVDNDGSSYDGTSSGSLLYASPEQLTEQGCSFSTDVYQLALVMFEALTGRLPFEISITGALAYRRGQGPVLLSDEELGPQSLNDPVRKVLEEALHRNPMERTRSMQSFIDELNAALNQLRPWGFRLQRA